MTPVRQFKRAAIALTCAAALVASVPGAASAETVRMKDKRDSYGFPPKREAPYDIRGARFTNGPKRITAVVELRNLWKHSPGWTQFNFSRGSRYYYVDVRRHRNGDREVLTKGIKRCPRVVARYQIRKSQVRFSIPQRCIKDGGRHRWEMAAWVGAPPFKGANAWDSTKSPEVAYR